MAEPKHRRKGQIINRNGVRTVRVYLGKDANGKRIYVNRTVKTSAKAADSVLDGLLDAVSGGSPTVKPTRMTVNELLDKWLEFAKENCRERTYNGYVWMMKQYIRPEFDRTPAQFLSHTDLEAHYSKLQRGQVKRKDRKGNEHKLSVSAQTVRAINALLSTAFNFGMKKKLLSANSCSLVTLPPRPQGKKRRALPAEQLSSFLKAAKEDRWHVIFSLSLESGLRPEEYLGLTWPDINLETGEIAVVRTLVWRKKGDWYFSTPKTERSDRTIVVSESLRLLLLDHRRKQLEERLKATNYSDNGFVFAMKNGRPVLHRTLDRRHFKPILERAGLPKTTRIYDMRHSCATLLIKNGESPKVVADRLGHSDPAFTLKTYVDTDSEQQKTASEKLAKILSR
jgi:integrase